MSTPTPTHAMVLAAGLGLRMRPLTATCPKPLISVAGRTMLDRALDHVRQAGVQKIVVNSHWLGEQIAAHLHGQADIQLSPEAELLETGGGVQLALPHLGDQPFYVANSDIIWTDGAHPTLSRLADAWDDERMDALLLLHPRADAMGYEGAGDFFLPHPDQPPQRRGSADSAPFIFAGVQILHPRLFAGAPGGKYSLNVLYDRALQAERLFAVVHDGHWYHVGTPDALEPVAARIRSRCVFPQAD